MTEQQTALILCHQPVVLMQQAVDVEDEWKYVSQVPHL
jgi:hypothetical protein